MIGFCVLVIENGWMDKLMGLRVFWGVYVVVGGVKAGLLFWDRDGDGEWDGSSSDDETTQGC